MVVLILERSRPSLRGELSRWMLEVKAGVFVGSLTTSVRERLWDLTCQELKGGAAATLIFPARNEQGFLVRFWGDPSRSVIDFEGLYLVEYRSAG